MRTRNQSKEAEEQGKKKRTTRVSDSIDDNETLNNISRDAVGKLLKRTKRGFNREDVGYLRRCESEAKPENGSNSNEQTFIDEATKASAIPESFSGNAIRHGSAKVEAEVGVSQFSNPAMDDGDDYDWEDGSVPSLTSTNDYREDLVNGVSVEFDVSPGTAKRKPVRRATAEEKAVAEFMHKAHLLCLLGRGRLMDTACNDPLIQASLVSLLPTHLLKIADSPKLTASQLAPLVSWFHRNFRVRGPSGAENSCQSALASTVETRVGTPEAVAAISVALFRALNLTSRFISVLDVVSLKPDADNWESAEIVSKGKRDIFNSSTPMVSGPSCGSVKSSSENEKTSSPNAMKGAGKREANRPRTYGSSPHKSINTDKLKEEKLDAAVSEPLNDTCEPVQTKSEGLKRKGDLEFQMQLEMALSSTAVGSSKNSNVVESPSTSSTLTLPLKRMKKFRMEETQSSSGGISIAIGSQKVGAPLYWAEVFCSGENLTGKWVHVDAVNAIVDGEHKVEAAATACKKSLRYVVAFAGSGAKDVTRRYCTKWYKVAPQRISSTWWDAVLAPMKELESGATNGFGLGASGEASRVSGLTSSHRSCGASNSQTVADTSIRNSFASTRSSLEDMELETRALTEPLPTNQQAYRSHHLYVIERWLKKYEILHPKGPVLGFCSGRAVYPRTCVQILHTKQKWLREGLQVKTNELPVKVIKRSQKTSKEEAAEDEVADGDYGRSMELYGKWQTEPLSLPRAVNGIVPKNERGQVDVWSEKCLPPGTVHLPLPRLVPIAKRFDVDFAPAMVGFEFKNGRSVPVFDGIVVCSEFKDAILEAYAEEEERREVEEKRRLEAQVLSRWYQLLSSIVTRQRLNNCYGNAASSQVPVNMPKSDEKSSKRPAASTKRGTESPRSQQTKTSKKQTNISSFAPEENHEHEFILDEPASDEECSVRVKRCHCGFSIQFEEL